MTVKDLRYVGVKCRTCQTEFVLDLASVFELPSADQLAGFAPPECPTCHVQFDAAIKPALDRLRDVYQALQKVSADVVFYAKGVE